MFANSQDQVGVNGASANFYDVADKAEADRPTVLISLTTLNSASVLTPFFKSLERQSYPLNKIAIHVCDRGSTDTTWSDLKRFKSNHKSKAAAFELIQLPEAGPGVAHDANITKSTENYIFLVSPDVQFDRHAISGAVQTATIASDDVAMWELRQLPVESNKIYSPVSLETSWAHATCTLIRRSAYERVGGFETNAPWIGTDVELSYRLRDSGYRLLYCPNASYWRSLDASPKKDAPTVSYEAALSNLFMRLRYGTTRQRLAIPTMLLSLFKIPASERKGKLSIFALCMKFARHTPHFLLSRKRSSRVFPLAGWGYDFLRPGGNPASRFVPDAVLPRVSIVVRTEKGREGLLAECVRSLANQTYTNFEIIVAEDGTSGFAKAVVPAELLGDPTRLKFVQSAKSGVSESFNAGLEEATGEYLAVIEDDNLFFADHVERLVTSLESDSKAVGVYSSCMEVATDVESADPLIYVERQRRTLATRAFSRPLLWTTDYILMTSVVFRRSCYDERGGFDTDLTVSAAWDLWIRYTLDRPFDFVDLATCLCRAPAEQIEQDVKQAEVNRNKILVRRKQKNYTMIMSPGDFLELHDELERENAPANVA